jgi:hypothetical protein
MFFIVSWMYELHLLPLGGAIAPSSDLLSSPFHPPQLYGEGVDMVASLTKGPDRSLMYSCHHCLYAAIYTQYMFLSVVVPQLPLLVILVVCLFFNASSRPIDYVSFLELCILMNLAYLP